ncbi:MAG: tetratricopeptide repeat protein [Candidatus Scalinduaceae bacterium]
MKKQYSFDDWYYKGAEEFINGKYVDAIDSFTNALEEAPDDTSAASVYNYRGSAYGRINSNEEAIEDYNNSINLKRDNPLPYKNKGNIYYRRKEFERAFENFIKAIKLYINKDDFERAVPNIIFVNKLFDKTVDIKPETKKSIEKKINQLWKEVRAM